MRDTLADRGKIIEYLETALALSEATGDAKLGYLIERALDEARSRAFVPLQKPPLDEQT